LYRRASVSLPDRRRPPVVKWNCPVHRFTDRRPSCPTLTLPAPRAVCGAQLVVDRGWSYAAAARRFMVAPRTAKKWADRYRAEGAAGMADRSSRPETCPNRTSPPTGPPAVSARWVQLGGHSGPLLRSPLRNLTAAAGALRAARGWSTEPGVRLRCQVGSESSWLGDALRRPNNPCPCAARMLYGC
jgi:transposase-like protein